MTVIKPCPFCGSPFVENFIPHVLFMGYPGGSINFTCMPCKYIMCIYFATSDEWMAVMEDNKEHGGDVEESMRRIMYDSAVQRCNNKIKSIKNSPEYETLAKKMSLNRMDE